MKIVDLAVRRPVTVTMLVVGVLFFGLLSWWQMPQDLYPAVSCPQLTVVTRYANAAPEEMETLVTRPIEEAVSTTRNLKSLHSLSREGISLVTAQFNWGTSTDFAALEMREKLDLIKEELPRDCEDPVVKKINPFAMPLMILSVSSHRPDPIELRRAVESQVKERLQKVPGVASVVLTGGRQKEVFVEVDPDRLRRRGLDLMKIIRAVKDGNVNYPAGSAKESFYEVVVRTLGEFKNAREIENVVVDRPQKEERRGDEKLKEETSLVYLRDLAEVTEGFKEKISLSRFNGEENISCSVYPQAQANPVKTATQVRRALEEIRGTLPKGISVALIYDKARFIEESIGGVGRDSLAGGFLAFGVLLFFLAQLRSSLIVSLSIPISIAATFTLMFLKGITVNMISLAGLALGIGMLVDNSIVIIENISRRRALGESWMDAALKGTKEVSGPITASTLTSIAVFLPMIFLTGVEGELFKDLALTVVFSHIASLAVALVLLPRWAAHQKENYPARLRSKFWTWAPMATPSALRAWMSQRSHGTHVQNLNRSNTHWTSIQINRLKAFYVALLKKCIHHSGKVIGATAAVFAVSILVLALLPKELLPKVDQGEFMVRLTLPMGTHLDATDTAAKKVEEMLLKEPAVGSVALTIGNEQDSESETLRALGSHQAQFVVICRGSRRESTARIVARLRAAAARLDLGAAQLDFLVQDHPFGGNFLGEGGIGVEVRGQDLKEMKNSVEKLKTALAAIPEVAQLKDNIPLPSPEIRVQINKDRSALYQLSSKEIALATQAAIKGVVATKLHEEGREVDVRVRLNPRDRKDLSSLNGIAITSCLDEEIPLEEVASLKSGEGPSEIERLDGARVLFISCQAGKGSESALEEKIERLLAQQKFPDGIQAALSGETQERRRSFTGLFWVLILAVVLMYMIMAAQFESFLEPFLILFTVPFSVIGVALILLVTATPLSAMIFLGLILLGGIVVNNGIVLISYLHDLLREGKGVEEAVVEAGATRLRPIVMTMLTSVLALTPFLLSGGREAQLQAPMALTLVGGLTISTLLTLFLLPLFYLRIDKLRQKRKSALPAYKSTAASID